MDGLRSFFKRNPLIVAMIMGVFIYLTYHWIPALHPAGPFLEKAVLTIQPILIFLMLFLQFSRTSPHDLKFRRWHLYLLIIQTAACLVTAAALHFVRGDVPRVLLEALMLCWICPTAIAAGVVTEKIDGSISGFVGKCSEYVEYREEKRKEEAKKEGEASPCAHKRTALIVLNADFHYYTTSKRNYMKTNALKGMKDILPAEQKLRDYVQGKILETYRASGFERISTPMLEDAENLDKSDGGDNLNLIFKVLKRGD